MTDRRRSNVFVQVLEGNGWMQMERFVDVSHPWRYSR